jgi:hypothetical protein
VLGINLGPATFAAPGRKFLDPRRMVMALLLAVNPAEAEGFIERFRIGD